MVQPAFWKRSPSGPSIPTFATFAAAGALAQKPPVSNQFLHIAKVNIEGSPRAAQWPLYPGNGFSAAYLVRDGRLAVERRGPQALRQVPGWVRLQLPA